MSSSPPSSQHTVDQLRAALPEGGMFAGKGWLLSPEPFPLSKSEIKRLTGLGNQLLAFQRACNDAYLRSARGKLPSWIAELLDAGKPDWLRDLSRAPGQRDALPGVIRPDLILGEEGFGMTELDSVPGGIGLTALLGELYSDLGDWRITGGAQGMREGFRSLMPEGGDIVISEESGDYRPEMEWMARALGEDDGVADRWQVHQAESYQPSDREIYRFFELFDHANIPCMKGSAGAVGTGELSVSPPLKPFLEEKLWLALFWSLPLREFWRRALRDKNFQQLAEIIPFGWVVDPEPLPPHGALPRLDAQSWDDVAKFSQKERHLALKISGFSELAWGSRGVHIGQDLPQEEWGQVLKTALGSFPTNPYVMQKFSRARIVNHPYADPETGEIKILEGRVRLCPYYFVPDGKKAQLGGVLATIVPSDKKLLHGMSDAILVPCCLGA